MPQDIDKLTKYYDRTSKGCLKISSLLAFYMNTKFFYYDKTKLQLTNKLYKIATFIDEAGRYRITNNKEMIVGPLNVSMKLLERFSREEIAKFAGGLAQVKDDKPKWKGHQIIIKDTAKYFKTFQDFLFLSALLMERKHIRIV